MKLEVDIHMPVINKDRFIVGHVLQRLLDQRCDGVETTFYVDASVDLTFPTNEDFERILALTATSEGDAERIKVNLRVADKRNKMLSLGKSPYVYFADRDVLLPDNKTIFASMLRGLERHPRLGAVGVCYQKRNHVATGSMMLRREDLERIGEIKWAGEACICNYIAKKLWELDKFVVPLRTIRATHLDREYRSEYLDSKEYPEEIAAFKEPNVLSQSHIQNIIGQYGAHFRLFIPDEMAN